MAGALLLAARDGAALTPDADGDGDGHASAVEQLLGSDPADAASTPESVAVADSCFDGADNDGDGLVDGDDPGCTGQAPAGTTFPPDPGRDIFDSSMDLDDYELVVGSGTCRVDFSARGPVIVERGAPSGGAMPVIETELLAMQLTGEASVLATSSGCPVPPGTYMVSVLEDPGQTSAGEVRDTTPDPATDFPADSFFDVFFEIQVDLNGQSVRLPGGPPGGPAGAAVRVENVVDTLPPYHGGENSLCYEVPGLAHEHCPKAPPDHYACYTAKFQPKPAKRDVTVGDQFEDDVRVTVKKPIMLCTPVAKNGEPIFDRTEHLSCYQEKPRKVERDVTVYHQFGQGLTVTTKKATTLCLPANKNDEGEPVELDPYQCYLSKFQKIDRQDVSLADQFGTVQAQVKKGTLLCNPASLDGTAILNPLEHLSCYRLKGPRVKQEVTVTDDFIGTPAATVVTKKLVMLCLPTGKQEGTSTTVPGGSTTSTTTGTDISTTSTTTVTGPTTTTIPLTEVTVVGSYEHVAPGEFSVVCGFGQTDPPLPGAIGTLLIDGPDPFMLNQTLPFDQMGVGPYCAIINQFGQYDVQIDVGGFFGETTIDVVEQPATCPQRSVPVCMGLFNSTM
jgi:hypothetical protein